MGKLEAIVAKLYYFEMEVTPAVIKPEGTVAVLYCYDLWSLLALKTSTVCHFSPANGVRTVLFDAALPRRGPILTVWWGLYLHCL